MNAERQRRIHKWLLYIFAAQIPIAVGTQILAPKFFDIVWQQYLIFLSIYAVCSTHWGAANAADAGAKAEKS